MLQMMSNLEESILQMMKKLEENMLQVEKNLEENILETMKKCFNREKNQCCFDYDVEQLTSQD